MIALALAVLAAQSAPAPADATPSSEVVVRARRGSEASEIHRFMRGFVELEGSDPLARFSTAAVCPGVAGLGEPQRTAIVARMRRVAQAAGLDVDRPGCRANALLILAPQRRQMLAWLRRARPNMFMSARREPVDVRDDGRATVAWQLLGMHDRWGTPIPGGSGGFATIALPDGASRLIAPVRPVVHFAAVLIDAVAIEGLTTTQLADYALLRLVAGADPARVAAGPPSIVRVLETPDGGEAPLTLTDWDFRYLKALYAVPPNHYGPRQRTAIKERMLRERRAAAD